MVLCAGNATRLRPLTAEVPKALLPFGDRSFLEHALALLARAGAGDEVVVNTHHLAGAFEALGARCSGRLRLVHEPVLRGTAGGIAAARSHFDAAPVLVMVGDVVLESVPDDLLDRARGGGLVLAVAPRALGQGTVGIGRNGEVVRLRGERFGEEISSGDYVGLAAIGADALAALPDAGCLVGDYALPALRRGERVQTSCFTSHFVLPGDDLESYFKANLDWLASHGKIHQVGEGAEIGPDVELESALIGRGARVYGRGRLRRVIVLEGASCAAPLEDAIVAPSGAILPLSKTLAHPKNAE
jgi:mannose-1-phosphate guanylyltransferase